MTRTSVAMLASLALSACGPVAGGEEDLRWYLTCGDPVCSNVSTSAAPPCTDEEAGEACASGDATCDPGAGCNVLLSCAAVDPRTQPGGCPISLRAAKREIEYLEPNDLASLHDELMQVPLATYRYRGAAHTRRQLGFIIEDVQPSPAAATGQGRVDLYGYTSMAVAALQVQRERIEELEQRLAALEAELARIAEQRER